MDELNAKIIIDKLKQFFNVKSQKELCKVLNWQESSVSGWIARNSIGAVVENLIHANHFETLKYIFCTDTTYTHNTPNNIVSAIGGQLAGNNIKVNQLTRDAFLTVRNTIENELCDEIAHKILSEVTYNTMNGIQYNSNQDSFYQVAKKYMDDKNARLYAINETEEGDFKNKTLDDFEEDEIFDQPEKKQQKQQYLDFKRNKLKMRNTILSNYFQLDSTLRALIDLLETENK